MSLDDRVRVVRAEAALPWTFGRTGSVRYFMPDGAVRVRLDGIEGDYFFSADQLVVES